MKSLVISAICLITTSLASAATDERLIGHWVTKCSTALTKESSSYSVDFYANGKIENTEVGYFSKDCTGAEKRTVSHRGSYTITKTDSPDQVVVTFSAKDPKAVANGDGIWFKAKLDFITEHEVSMKMTDVIIKVAGRSFRVPSLVLKVMPSETMEKQ